MGVEEKESYSPPTQNTKLMPIFCRRGIFSRHTMGIGNNKIAISVTVLIEVRLINNAW